ncbi:hypothetical protein COU80_04325 [Candidatus Peregrinibacteria bacterium CG10_big_fil_rev_8_21_14_0_10_55_24]|nr:MAG: hypothetical protein COU80_04325 [Candidatus Peregrinibacteria bacterium CG10_big_fil_rev_8_21_14_0_10_55_24]
MRCFCLRSGLLLALSATPLCVLAYTGSPDAAVQQVASSLPSTGVGSTFGQIFEGVISALIPLTYFVAALVVVRAALLLILEQSESELSQFKRSLISAIVAVFVINLAGVLSSGLITIVTSPSNTVSVLKEEMAGLVNWIEVPLAVIAVTMIIVSGIRAVLSYGSDDGVTHVRRTLISVLLGIFFIITKGAFANAFAVNYRPDGLIAEIVPIIALVLGFVTLLAVIVLIIAGLMMVVNLGNDERYQRARGIVVRVILGILIILMSSAIIGVFLVTV